MSRPITPAIRSIAFCGIVLYCLTASAQGEATTGYRILDEMAREAESKVDRELPGYKPTGRLAGKLRAGGSDNLNNLMTLFEVELRKSHPSVEVQVMERGGTTAYYELLSGRSDFGLLSREFNEKELKELEAKFGHKPTLLAIAYDVLGVWVHKDNPIESLTLAELGAIFSEDRKLGGTKDITTWGQLGLKGEWARRRITLHGRNPASGNYGFFKIRALDGGDFKDSVNEHPSSSSIVRAVANDVGSIGYTGIGYETEGVRFVPLAPAAGQEAVPATAESAYRGDYPLGRPLYVAVNVKPGTELEPLRREFIQLIFSKQGQAMVVVDGYIPVNAKIAREQLEKVGLGAGVTQ